jgi:hypothetical protein
LELTARGNPGCPKDWAFLYIRYWLLSSIEFRVVDKRLFQVFFLKTSVSRKPLARKIIFLT